MFEETKVFFRICSMLTSVLSFKNLFFSFIVPSYRSILLLFHFLEKEVLKKLKACWKLIFWIECNTYNVKCPFIIFGSIRINAYSHTTRQTFFFSFSSLKLKVPMVFLGPLPMFAGFKEILNYPLVFIQ